MPFSVLGLLPQVSPVWRGSYDASSVLGGCYLQFSRCWEALTMPSQFWGLLPQVFSVWRALTMPFQFWSCYLKFIRWGSSYLASFCHWGCCLMFSFIEGAVTTSSQLLTLLPQGFSVGELLPSFYDCVFNFQNSHCSLLVFPLSLVKLLINKV